MSRLRANKKKQAGEFAEEIMAYSMELEALSTIDKKNMNKDYLKIWRIISKE